MKEKRIYINRPKDVNVAGNVILFATKQEHFVIFCLNRYNRLLKAIILSIGYSDNVDFTIRDIFSQAKRYETERIITLHNHPIGLQNQARGI